MSIVSFFANLLPAGHKTWPVTIVVNGQRVQATAFEETTDGRWHVSYLKPGTYKEYTMKWIVPNDKQIAARGEK